MGQVENSLFGKPHYKQCKNCGCEFRVGKGINSKGKKLTKVGLVFAICTLGTSLINPMFSCQKYCSRECWRADTGNN
ncbi:MAG: hypothetical protein J6N81_00050 [Treponema sp.]|nr:hypothetical protein [Treponema sp.]MBQ8013792.1 hypothetical protein [Treponema sp.]